MQLMIVYTANQYFIDMYKNPKALKNMLDRFTDILKSLALCDQHKATKLKDIPFAHPTESHGHCEFLFKLL